MKKGINTQTKLDRRKFLQIVAVAGAVGAGWTLGLSRGGSRYKVVHKSQPMMGTVVNLTLYGPEESALEAAAHATIERMLELERHLSRHSTDSEVARLNQTGTLLNPGEDVRAVLTMAQGISEKTNGAFDITVLPLVKLQQND